MATARAASRIEREVLRLGRKKAADPRDFSFIADQFIPGVAPPRAIDEKTLRKAKRLGLDPAFADLADLVHYIPRGNRIYQGETSRCTVFTCAADIMAGPEMQDIHAIAQRRFGGSREWAFEQFMWEAYNWAQRNDEWVGENYDGTSERAAIKFFRDRGFWKVFYRLTSARSIVRYILTQRRGVKIGTDWFTGMDVVDRRGYVHPTGDWRGGHMFLIRGANATQRKVGIDNWWREWGIKTAAEPEGNGLAWIDLDELDQLLLDGGMAYATDTEIRQRIAA